MSKLKKFLMTFALALCMSLAVLYIQRQTHTTEAFSFFADRVRACGEHRRSLCAPGCARSDVYPFPPFIFSTLLYPKSQALGILKKEKVVKNADFQVFVLPVRTADVIMEPSIARSKVWK